MIKVYSYKNCSSCQKAIKYLNSAGHKYQELPIVDTPPSLAELNQMLTYLNAQGGSFKNLFNTSGALYRELQVADKLKAGLCETQALELLSQNGKLIKRPFLLTDSKGTVGFKEETWDQILGKS
jgi:arsenate reductase (glutaredoxin)